MAPQILTAKHVEDAATVARNLLCEINRIREIHHSHRDSPIERPLWVKWEAAYDDFMIVDTLFNQWWNRFKIHSEIRSAWIVLDPKTGKPRL